MRTEQEGHPNYTVAVWCLGECCDSTPRLSTMAVFLDLPFSMHVSLLRITLLTEVQLSIWVRQEAEALTWGVEFKGKELVTFRGRVTLGESVGSASSVSTEDGINCISESIYVMLTCHLLLYGAFWVGFLMPCSDRRAVRPPLRTVTEYIVLHQETWSF